MKLTPDEIKVLNANRNFDRAHTQWRRLGKLKSGWSTDRYCVGKPLTDEKIQAYCTEGFYSDDLEASRRAYQRRSDLFHGMQI